MVHWLGGNTRVLICLAREATPTGYEDKALVVPAPSVVFISFDYGDTFENKTDLFRVPVNGTTLNSTLDGFSTHPKFHTVRIKYSRNVISHNNSPYLTYISDRFHRHSAPNPIYEQRPRTHCTEP